MDPAQFLNLSNWYLTLPTGQDGNPDTVKQPALSTYTNPNHFYYDPTTQGIVFRAHCGGVRTQNSNYPRSELREMNGSLKANWPLAGIHSLTTIQSVDVLPVVKPEVVVAQIHQYTGDLVVVLCQKQKNGRVRMVAKHKKQVYGILADDYMLGTRFKLQIYVQDGNLSFWFNDVCKAEYSTVSEENYFKVGAYTQSSCERGDAPDAYAQVTLYDCMVFHQ